MLYKETLVVWEETNYLKKIIGKVLFKGFVWWSGMRISRDFWGDKVIENGIFVAYHQQFFDLVWLGSVLSKKVNHKVWFAVHRHNFGAFSWRILSWVLPIIFIDDEVKKQKYKIIDDKVLIENLGKEQDENLNKNLEKIKLASFLDVLKRGESVFLFPEGTFNIDSQKLLPFYHGASNLARISQKLIYPIGIAGNCLFKVSPFPITLKDQLKSVLVFFRGGVILNLGKVLSCSEFNADFQMIKYKTFEIEKRVASLSGLKISQNSKMVEKLRKMKVVDQLIVDYLEKMGVKCVKGVKFHWRSLDLLERIWNKSGKIDLNISIDKDCEIGDKVYLFPQGKIEKKKLKNLVIGNLKMFADFFY